MEKEPRRDRRGLDSETLSTLESTGPEYLTTTASAHTAKEAVNLLILAVVRLERALQRVHPLTIRQGKHTRDYNPAERWTSSQSAPPLDGFAGRPDKDNFFPQASQHWGQHSLSMFRATFARVPRGFLLLYLSTYSQTACPHSPQLPAKTLTVFPPTSRSLSRFQRTFSPNTGTIVSTLHEGC